MRAIQFVRHNAADWNIDPKRAGVTATPGAKEPQSGRGSYLASVNIVSTLRDLPPVEKFDPAKAVKTTFDDTNLLGKLPHRAGCTRATGSVERISIRGGGDGTFSWGTAAEKRLPISPMRPAAVPTDRRGPRGHNLFVRNDGSVMVAGWSATGRKKVKTDEPIHAETFDPEAFAFQCQKRPEAGHDSRRRTYSW